MHLTTKGLVLREVNYKEADKLLTVLTEDEGKLTVTARGCRKRASPIAAASQLLVWSELTMYEYRGRWTIKEAATERQFQRVRFDLEKLSLASYFAEVTESLAGEGEREPGLLSLILNSLHALDRLALPLLQVKTAFEWKSMALAGYAPKTDGCAVCGLPDPESPCIHLREGLVHCASCRDRLGDGTSMPLTPGALSALRHIVNGDPKRLFSFRLDKASLRQMSDASEAYLMTQLERGFRTLDFFKSLNTDIMET